MLETAQREVRAAGLDKLPDALPSDPKDLSVLDPLPKTISIVKEAMWHHDAGVAERMVMGDHWLSDKYLLKCGSQ